MQLAWRGSRKIKKGTSLHFPQCVKVRYGGLANERDMGFGLCPFFVGKVRNG